MNKSHETRLFWIHVKIGSPEDCWIWRGGKFSSGYGYHEYEDIGYRSHRLAWILTYGEIPEGMLVLHRCDNPPCCNPNHLFLGTNKDNMEDRNNKNRQGRMFGEKNPASKLTQANVDEIRSRYAPLTSSDYERGLLALEFGVSPRTIEKVINRNSWNPDKPP
jgi:hypothetical protein